jgi:membrane-associated protein
MTQIPNPVDFILHIDKYVGMIIQNYGIFTYLILFLVLFCETGLVITPFLPGDSLLFVTGAFAAKGYINVFALFGILCLAAILGDTINYTIGNYFGEKVFARNRFFKKEHLEKTKKFYEKHGSKTIIFARFVPIVRTFAPFVAGIGKMKYLKFLSFNIIGGIAWVLIFLFGGYFFGGIPIIEKNLTWVIFIIIFISILPAIIEYLRNRKKN